MLGWLAGFAGTGLALMYLVVSAAGAQGFWHEVNLVKLVIAGTAGIMVSCAAGTRPPRLEDWPIMPC